MNSQPDSIRLFVKPGCPWCKEVINWFNERDVTYTALDVVSDPIARREMRELTGQSRAPSMEADGVVLADFGVDELETWWTQQGFKV